MPSVDRIYVTIIVTFNQIIRKLLSIKEKNLIYLFFEFDQSEEMVEEEEVAAVLVLTAEKR